jgi:glutamate--cysteine ligase
MRGSDGGPARRLPSLPAYWVGILYDDDCLQAAWDLVKDWTAEERQKLRDDVPAQGFRAVIRGRNTLELARETLALAHQGLVRRQRLDRNGRDETRYLRPLDEIVAQGITPAEELLQKFHGPWGGSVDPVYIDYAY